MTRCLVLHAGYSVPTSYYDDWVDGFRSHPRLDTEIFNLFPKFDPASLKRGVSNADLVVVLHSGTADTLDYLRPATAHLKNRRCPLVVLMGNEFNMPWLPFEERRAWLREAHVDVVGTQLLLATGQWLYADTGARVVSVPHALNPKAFAWKTVRRARQVDIGTRSFPYPVYLGDTVRNEFLKKVSIYASTHELAVDISTRTRFSRAAWAAFLNECRFTAATEAGSSYLYRDDALAIEIRAFLRSRRKRIAISPRSVVRHAVRRLPWGVREMGYRFLRGVGVAHEAIENDSVLQAEVIDRFFRGRPPPEHHGGCVSSRHFDAIGCGTAQILVEGRYNDILSPHEHYIPVARDLSNLSDVLTAAREPGFGDDVAQRAHDHVRENHTIDRRIEQLVTDTFAGSC